MKRLLGGLDFRFTSKRLQRSGTYLLSGLICLLTVALYLGDHRALATWELGIQDLMVSLGRHPQPSPDVVVVTIDDQAVKKLGKWPWNAERVGYLVGMLAEYQPRAIGLDFELSADATTDPAGNKLLSDMIAHAANVVLPMRFTLGTPGTSTQPTPDYILKSSYVTTDDAIMLMDHPYPQARHVAYPYDAACRAAWGLGQTNTWQDLDAKVRRDPLVVHFEGEYYPSMALQLARCARGILRTQVKLVPDKGIVMGPMVVPCNDDGLLLIDYRGGAGTFKSVSAADILEGQSDKKDLSGKIVIVGVTASGYGTTLSTPASPAMPRTEKIATVTANILDGRYITTVTMSTVIDLLILAVIAAFCAVVLPRVVLMYRVVILLVVAFLFLDLNFILYNSFKLITKTLYPSLEILLFLLFSPVIKVGATESVAVNPRKRHAMGAPTPGSAPVPAMKARTAARSLRGNVTVDEDGVPVRMLSDGGPAAVIDGLERTMVIETGAIPTDLNDVTGQSAVPAPETMDIVSGRNESTFSVEEGPRDLMNASPAPLGADLDTSDGRDVPTAAGAESTDLKRLGRYEILGVLGQGAMGTVYKGKDPAIDRLVALKTIRAGIGDAPAAEELRERLVREAKAAGKLSHPNIVTIYDVGADGDLRYIAMEYLEGYTLEQVVRKKVQLNYRIAARILMQVCAALEYAHNAGIVHRDIKPANIMVLDNFKIKVTDFGIARFNSPSMSMTQTGIALGTPHYIAPEQLRGGPIDRRCDIFSLGVVAYELLTHKRPFVGDNITALIYSITQTTPAAPSTVDENIPGIFDVVIKKALAKDPLERYQSADEMANDLKAFVEEMTTKSFRI